MENNKLPVRNSEIDILKGIGIILVVWGHCGGPFNNFIYLFHMAIFFIASGYCWNNSNVYVADRRKAFLKKRTIRLYIPFLLFNTVLIILNNLFVKISIYPENAFLSFKNISIQIMKTILFGGGEWFGGATWFLKALFIISIEYYLVSYLVFKNKKIGMFVFFLVFFVNMVFSQYFARTRLGMFSYFSPLPAAYLAFVFGIFERKYFSMIKTKLNLFLHFIIVVICAVFLALLTKIGSIDMAQGSITNVLFFGASCLFGWHMVLSFSCLISKIRVLEDVLKYIGKHTMPILLFHFISYKTVSLFYILVFKKDFELMRSFPVISGVNLIWIFYLFFGVSIPLLIEFVWSKWILTTIKRVIRLLTEK